MCKWSFELGFEFDIVEVVIEYMYIGCICVSMGSVYEVLELVDRFLFICLKEFCGEFFKKKFYFLNCVVIYSLVYMYILS